MKDIVLAVAISLVLTACSSGPTTAVAPTDATPPTTPAAVSATAQSTSSVVLTWQAATDSGLGVAGYSVYRDGASAPIATLSGTRYVDVGLIADTQYTYFVSAFDAALPANESRRSSPAIVRLPAEPGLAGLDSRPANASCLAGDSPANSTAIAEELAFPGVSFSQPVLMLQAPANSLRWYVVEKTGRVKIFDNLENVGTSRVFADVASQITVDSNEMGLLGMAFHPNYPSNPRAYLSFTATVSGQLVLRIAEYQTRDGGQTLDPTTMVPILTINKPEAEHHGGNIAFGRDKFLYIGVGDGGGSGDSHGQIGNGQRLSTLLGKMLRINVNSPTGATAYSIPSANPYFGNAVCDHDTGAYTQNCPEIYAYGFRNPWRWSFDRVSGELWLGDVGQNTWEEVDKVVKGGNYGWRCREGAHAFYDDPVLCGPAASSGTTIDPVANYDHAQGVAVTGGFVYRGNKIPALSGQYVFGDFGSGRIWHIARDTAPTLEVTAGFDSGLTISSFAQGADGEIYMLDYGGTIHRLVPAAAGGRTIPTQLSGTGCVDATDHTKPASGLIPYEPNAQFWSDGATKAHFLALPDGQQISINTEGDFEFPNGSVLVKNFRLGATLVETRLLMRHNSGDWAGYTYEWNAEGTDAARVVGGKSVQVGGQEWLFPSEAQCLICHTSAAGRSLGLEVAQLNGTFGYMQTGRTANQLTTLDALHILTPALTQPVEQLPALPNPMGTTGTIAERARSYLHTNCAQCHRPGGGTPVNLDFRYSTPLASTNACDVAPQSDLGIANAKIIAVGGSDAAARSILIARTSRTDADSMPPIQPRVVDTAGVTLLSNWINGLTRCN
jgi:uncharacterized repeat protein (TIGR03806 family)